MIEQLTKEQEAQKEVYRDKWIRIGLDTRKADREKAEAGVRQVYEANDKKMPPVEWAESPVAAIDLIQKKYSSATEKVEILNNFCYGQHDAGCLGFYDFFYHEVGLKKECEKMLPFIDMAKYCGWFLLYDQVVCFAERPIEINLIANDVKYRIHDELPEEAIVRGALHKDGAGAVVYRDGYTIWALNGVKVSQEIAETPWNELDPKLVTTTENAEVRRELVRKIGVEKILSALDSETLDTEGDYELLLLQLDDDRKRPYLKMTNPSLGIYHIEGIHPDITSVKEALKWRNGTEEVPTVLT